MTISRGIINRLSRIYDSILNTPPKVSTAPPVDPSIGDISRCGLLLIIRLTPKLDIHMGPAE